MNTNEKHTPEYSERGPVFVARSYETTDECAPSSRIAWRVQDLDDQIYAWDCAEQDAKDIARALNSAPALLAALEANMEALEVYVEWHNARWPDDKDQCAKLSGDLKAARRAILAVKGDK